MHYGGICFHYEVNNLEAGALLQPPAQREQELREQEHAAQREQELLAQKQAAQEKEEPPQNSVFRQPIEEMCGIKASAEQKKKLEDKMLELLEDCRQKELYYMHNDVEDLIEIIHKESTIPLNKTPQISPVIVITHDLPTEEPEYSLSMGDKHLDTILETESDEVIKSSVENLVLIPSESEDFFDNESECDGCPGVLSHILMRGKTIWKEKFKIIIRNPLFDEEKSFLLRIIRIISLPINLIESLLKSRYFELILPLSSSPKFDYLLEEFAGELAHIDPIPPIIEEADFDLEKEIRLIENLSNDSLPLPENESSNLDHFNDPSSPRPPSEPPDVEICLNFKPDAGILTTKMVKGIYEHYVLMPNTFPTLPTPDPDSDFTPSHDSLGYENKIFNPGIFIEVQSERLLSRDEFSISFTCDPLFDTLLLFSSENEDKVFNPGILASPFLSHRDKITSDFSENPMMIYGGDIPVLDIPYLHFYRP
ncbi:hypothetical protein Tco_0641281 [Tanacetum coccineum]